MGGKIGSFPIQLPCPREIPRFSKFSTAAIQLKPPLHLWNWLDLSCYFQGAVQEPGALGLQVHISYLFRSPVTSVPLSCLPWPHLSAHLVSLVCWPSETTEADPEHQASRGPKCSLGEVHCQELMYGLLM